MITINFDEISGMLEHHSDPIPHFGEDEVGQHMNRFYLPRPGTISFTTREPDKYLRLVRSCNVEEFLLVLPEHEMRFPGIVTSVTFPTGIDYRADVLADVEIKLTARGEMMQTKKVDVTTFGGVPEVPNARSHKFYIASPNAFSNFEARKPGAPSIPWAKKTLDEATEHAQRILEADPSKDEVQIVKVVRIVKRRKLPIKIEDVR